MERRIGQSFSWWCFEGRGVEAEVLLAGAAEIGYRGVDLIEPELWPVARRHGLRITAMGGHLRIEDGLNRAANAERIEAELRESIAKARSWDIPVVICFSGNRGGIDDEQGLAQCAETLRRVTPCAEAAGVRLAMELLNSRVDHPDYQCDHTEWGLELCRRVGSPAFGLLYDIYHMQIMEGDIIRTIRGAHGSIAHFHTAGNPGRGQPDGSQELNYAAIYAAIAATPYRGFISHEFLPEGEPLGALRRAYEECAGGLGAQCA